jgi:phosphoribosylglycinamide formyltransferase 2
MISPGAAEVIYAGLNGNVGAHAAQQSKAGRALADALRAPESDVRVFGGQSAEPEARRPLGAAVVTASDVDTARNNARQVSAALRSLW